MLQIGYHILKPNLSLLNTCHTSNPQNLYLTIYLGKNFLMFYIRL
jgi:hypothetical protein